MSTLQPQHFRKVRAGDYALAYPPEGSVAAKQPEREQLARDVEAFLKRGGKIQQVTQQTLTIPKLTAAQRAVLFTLAKSGRIDERKFTHAKRQVIKQLDSMKLAFRAKNFCQLTEHGVAVFNHLNFATQGVQL